VTDIQFTGGPKDGCVYIHTEPMPGHLSVIWPLPESPVNVDFEEDDSRMHLYELKVDHTMMAPFRLDTTMRFVYCGVQPLRDRFIERDLGE